MADDNPVARINSQIFQSRDIKGCKLHFWSNAPGGCTVQQFQPGEEWGVEAEGQPGVAILSSSARTGIIVLLTK